MLNAILGAWKKDQRTLIIIFALFPLRLALGFPLINSKVHVGKIGWNCSPRSRFNEFWQTCFVQSSVQGFLKVGRRDLVATSTSSWSLFWNSHASAFDPAVKGRFRSHMPICLGIRELLNYQSSHALSNPWIPSFLDLTLIVCILIIATYWLGGVCWFPLGLSGCI